MYGKVLIMYITKDFSNHTGAAHSARQGWQYCGITEPSVSSQKLNSTNHLSCEYYRCWRIWRGESRPLKTNATGEHKTKEYVWQRVNILAGRQQLLQSRVKRRKLSRFGHVCRHDTPSKIILQGTVDGGRRRRGRPRKSRKDDIMKWTGQSMSSMLCIADDRGRWAVITSDASGGVLQRRLDLTDIS